MRCITVISIKSFPSIHHKNPKFGEAIECIKKGGRSLFKWMRLGFLMLGLSAISIGNVSAEDEKKREEILKDRMEYYHKYSSVEVPWYYLAAIDQFERNIQEVRHDLKKKDEPIAMNFSSLLWAGLLNPSFEDQSPFSITYFDGIGKDGDQDGVADRNNPDDTMYTLTEYLKGYVYKKDDFTQALMDLYDKKETVHQIKTIAKIYAHFETNALDQRAFPLPVTAHYSYQGTWGASRGWGGRRIHEGTDLFAGYGVPVRSVSYGVIEVKGWNEYGGWRVGIRDMHNTYHYYAHLSSFNKEWKEGDIVEPGDVIGFVGSSGYGKEGTSGRFPPHLHYGMYKYNGRVEWAFDPYPYLQIWEKEEKL